MRSNERGTEGNSVIYSCTAGAAVRRLFFYPLYVGHFYCNGDYHVSRRAYNSFLLMYVRRGSGFCRDSRGTRSLPEGSLVLLDCYAPHEYFTDTGWEIYWVHYDGPMARDYYDYALGKNRLVSANAGQRVLRRFQRLLEFYEKGSSPEEVLVCKSIHDLLTELMSPVDPADAGTQRSAAVDEAVRYMSEHFDQRLSLETLAAAVSMSTCYFAHVFKEETGLSPHRYLTEIRLEYSRYLLKTGDLPVQEIAERCGFSNAGAFSASFRQHMGCTPMAYRRT